MGDTEQPTEDSEDISEEMVDNSSDATMEDVENAENSEDAFGGAEEGVSEEISSEDDPEVLLTELIPEEAGDSMEEEKRRSYVSVSSGADSATDSGSGTDSATDSGS